MKTLTILCLLVLVCGCENMSLSRAFKVAAGDNQSSYNSEEELHKMRQRRHMRETEIHHFQESLKD
jgi:hypothetical protein